MSRLQAPRGARPVTPDLSTEATAPSSERPSVRRLYFQVLATAAIVVAFDQLTKHLAVGALKDGRSIDVIEGILRFRLTYNSGGAFGSFQNIPYVFLIATLVIIGGILLGIRKVEDPRWAVPLGMVLGGGLGNALDRLVRDTDGAVVDFIDLHVWPVFNVADMAITFGALGILFLGWRDGPAEDES